MIKNIDGLWSTADVKLLLHTDLVSHLYVSEVNIPALLKKSIDLIDSVYGSDVRIFVNHNDFNRIPPVLLPSFVDFRHLLGNRTDPKKTLERTSNTELASRRCSVDIGFADDQHFHHNEQANQAPSEMPNCPMISPPNQQTCYLTPCKQWPRIFLS